MYSFLADSLRSRQAVLIRLHSIFQGFLRLGTRFSFNPCIFGTDGVVGGKAMVFGASRFLLLPWYLHEGLL